MMSDVFLFPLNRAVGFCAVLLCWDVELYYLSVSVCVRQKCVMLTQLDLSPCVSVKARRGF